MPGKASVEQHVRRSRFKRYDRERNHQGLGNALIEDRTQRDWQVAGPATTNRPCRDVDVGNSGRSAATRASRLVAEEAVRGLPREIDVLD